MSDFCIQVIVNAATHTLPAEQQAYRLVNGDILAVYPAADIGSRAGDVYSPLDDIGSKRAGFIFVIDAPELDIPTINDVLANDPVNSTLLTETEVPRRNWSVSLTPGELSTLQSVKHMTMSFGAFFAKCGDKLHPEKTLSDMGVTV